MAFLLVLIVWGLYLWLCWYLAEQFYEAAKAKGFSDRKYFWITFWLGPIGYCLVIALPDRGVSLPQDTGMLQDTGMPQGRILPQNNSTSVFYDDLPDL